VRGYGQPYKVRLQGKQVRDNIHSFDLANAFWQFFKIRERAKFTTWVADGTQLLDA
jgi:hypothetical protein